MIPTVMMASATSTCGDDSTAPLPSSGSILQLLGVQPSAESIDYVDNKKQFQLDSLTTEKRHPKTMTLSDVAPKDIPGALNMLFSVDDDITDKLKAVSKDPGAVKKLSAAIKAAVLAKKHIYVYGCGSTGRLAKLMESTFWRPFWTNALSVAAAHPDIKTKLSGLSATIPDELIGEMTGADRALISSLEGFEDLQLIGQLQLTADRGITQGDVVIAVTEGGETSSVIGTILGAHDQWVHSANYSAAEASNHLFFVYDNPDSVLMPFDRSRSVIEQDGITKVNLTTGPMAITGSTRMQATSIQTFVIAHALQDAVVQILREAQLDANEMKLLGFDGDVSLEDRLASFDGILSAVKKTVPELAKLTQIEADTYHNGHYATYFGLRSLIPVFIDGTERGPTFSLFPLDVIGQTPRQSWFQVWTTATDAHDAWSKMLGRPFHGLDPKIYEDPFTNQIPDPYLKASALESLDKAGDDQEKLYDFSFTGGNLQSRGPVSGDLGVLIAVDDDEIRQVGAEGDFSRFTETFQERRANVGLITVGTSDVHWSLAGTGVPLIRLQVGRTNDPFRVGQNVALKMLLNAHSTAVMARLDKVVGNTMTAVSATNLKLIGRATYLIQLHVTDVLSNPHWVQLHGQRDGILPMPPISYADFNAVLYDAIPYVKAKQSQHDQDATAVGLSIVRILESLRQRRSVSLDDCLALLKKGGGLNAYLADVRTN